MELHRYKKTMPVISHATPAEIARAAQLLRDGALVAFPTETVFGLGADATNTEAVLSVFKAKQRPADNPLSIMVHSIHQAETLAVVNTRALSLMHAFWPGPVSIILPQRMPQPVASVALGGLASISLRMPDHPVALALLKQAGIPVAAPSANPSGHLSTVKAMDVAQSLGDSVTMILADATPVIGIESTLIDLTSDTPKILRSGALTREQIEAVIGPVDISGTAQSVKPIMLNTPLRLNAIDVKEGEAFLGFGNTGFIGVEKTGFVQDMKPTHWRNLSAQGDLHEAAKNLYTMLQELDQAGASAIAVQRIPEDGLGVTLNDRLRRAAGH